MSHLFSSVKREQYPDGTTSHRRIDDLSAVGEVVSLEELQDVCGGQVCPAGWKMTIVKTSDGRDASYCYDPNFKNV